MFEAVKGFHCPDMVSVTSQLRSKAHELETRLKRRLGGTIGLRIIGLKVLQSVLQL
jgi:hypothetical protein